MTLGYLAPFFFRSSQTSLTRLTSSKKMNKLYKKPFFPILSDLAFKTNSRLYLVGGCIRDYLLKRPCNDYDFAVLGEAIVFAQEVFRVLGGSFVLLDEGKGSVRVVLKSKKHLINLDFNNLKAKDIQSDLRMRDFTINALAIDLTAKEIEFINPINGLKDMEAKTIRVISNNTFQDDPLRMLRAIRLSSELGFEIEKDTWKALVRLKGLITEVSVERITNEIYLTLGAKNSSHFITQLDKSGLLEQIIPEIIPLKGIEQDTYHHLPVWEHSLATLTQLEGIVSNLDKLFPLWQTKIKRYLNQKIGGNHTRLANLKMSCLFHDIGKSVTRIQEPSGRIRFTGHEIPGAKIASKIAHRLNLSNKEKKMLVLIVRNHMRPGNLVQAPILTDKALHRFFRDLGEEGVSTLLLSLADRYAILGPKVPPKNLHKHYEIIRLIIDKFYSPTLTITPPKLLKGSEIMEHLGIPAGPLIGKLLKEVEDAYVDRKITNKKEALSLLTLRRNGNFHTDNHSHNDTDILDRNVLH